MISINNQDNIHQQLEMMSDIPDLKSFDLYQHMKLNVKDFEKNCKDNVDNELSHSFYCITCKVSVCNLCNYNAHKSHFLIKKINFDLERSTIEKIFNQIESEIESKPILNDNAEMKEELKDIVTANIEVLHKKLEDLKEAKFKEINSLFSSESPVANLKKGINDIKNNISNFFEKNKKFLNYDKFNNDYENTIFLVVFEMMNQCVQKNKEVKSIMTKIDEDYESYKTNLKQKYNELSKLLQDFTKEEEKAEKERQDGQRDSIAVQNPKVSIISNFEKLNGDFYKDVKLRTQKYNEHVESFKTLAFETIAKTGSFKEIEKIINLFDKKNEKGIAYIFSHGAGEDARGNMSSPSQRMKMKQMSKSGKKQPFSKGLELHGEGDKNGNNGIIHTEYNSNPNGENQKTLQTEEDVVTKTKEDQQSVSSNSHLQTKALAIKSKNDIKLDNPIIRRYFAYATLDVVNKNFRIKTNAGVTSSAYLLIKPDFEMEEGQDVCKPIIGTNEIHIYDRKKRQLLRKKVNLDKHMHGFSYFLDGTRHVLVNDKLFITGGRDTNQEFNTVLTYDIKEFHLKRVPDMKVPHSYHSIEYVEMFKSLLVIGGQNNKYVELYDLFTNRWRLLPELNSPRANPLIYFDKSENHIYTLFGLKGDIVNQEYSDVIEVMELQNMAKGWTNIEYENKSELDFKLNYCQIYPLTRDKILIYGANSSRNPNKSFAVYMMDRFEIIKVDKKLLEELRLQSRKSAKLSKILSTMSK